MVNKEYIVLNGFLLNLSLQRTLIQVKNGKSNGFSQIAIMTSPPKFFDIVIFVRSIVHGASFRLIASYTQVLCRKDLTRQKLR